MFYVINTYLLVPSIEGLLQTVVHTSLSDQPYDPRKCSLKIDWRTEEEWHLRGACELAHCPHQSLEFQHLIDLLTKNQPMRLRLLHPIDCYFTVLTVEIIFTVWEDILICIIIRIGIPFLRTTNVWIIITLKIWQFTFPYRTWETKINSVNTGITVILRWEARKWCYLRVVGAKIYRWRP